MFQPQADCCSVGKTSPIAVLRLEAAIRIGGPLALLGVFQHVKMGSFGHVFVQVLT